jgi:uncharacterized protein (UPF0335 family)
LTNIFSDPKLKDDLLALIKRKIEIEQSINSYADDLADIKKEAEGLGLKITEFNRIVKHIVNQEAALNELAAIEMIVDNLGEINE